jgi:DNA-binding winged helix-turn-helix (wHTH) protein
MQEEASLIFGTFRLDVANACLWRGQQKLVLTPKAFAVLRYLVEHPGQLLAKMEFFQTIWPDTYVSDAALSVCIREIRKALDDNPKAPRFIETVHRRGFRFIAPLTTSPPPVSSANFQVPSRQTEDGHQQQRTGN